MIDVVELQLISRILDTGSYSIIEDNCITDEFFEGTGYEEEFAFIKAHYQQYGNVPDEATFLDKFKDIELVRVTESDKYLIDALREEFLFRRMVPVVEKVASLADKDANAASEYMMQAIKDLTPNYNLGGIDLVKQAEQRLLHYKDKVEKQDDFYFSSGFPEVDTVIHGIKRGEELVVIFARTNQGKSWVLEKMITHIWKQGANVGYISPEMSADSVGYRFDTLYQGYSNKDLVWGNTNIDIEQYTKYIEELKTHPNKFIVATPSDFDRKITVSKLRKWVKQYNLEAIAIDGITYMTDERGKRNDNKTTSLTNISEDLMTLSVELEIPVFVVVQANRGGVVEEDDGTPELENIRDCDGISHNATKVFSLRQKDACLEIGLKKHRDGQLNKSFKYLVNLNNGEFTYTEGTESMPKAERVERRERKKNDGKDVF